MHDTRTIVLGELQISAGRPKVNVHLHIDMARINQLVQKAARNAQGTTSFGNGAITLMLIAKPNRPELKGVDQ